MRDIDKKILYKTNQNITFSIQIERFPYSLWREYQNIWYSEKYKWILARGWVTLTSVLNVVYTLQQEFVDVRYWQSRVTRSGEHVKISQQANKYSGDMFLKIFNESGNFGTTRNISEIRIESKKSLCFCTIARQCYIELA